MTISVPQSSLGFGAVDRSPRQDPNGPSRILNPLAADIQGAALRIDRQQRANELRDRRMEATVAYREAKTEFDQDNDFATMEDRFAERDRAIRETVLNGADPRILGDLNASLDDLGSSYGSAIAARSGRLRLDHDRGLLSLSLDEYGREAAAAGDPSAQLAILSDAHDDIQNAFEAGTITEVEAEQRRRALDETVQEAVALRLLDEDPAGLAAALQGDGFSALDPAQRQRLKISAKREVQTRADRARVAADRAAEKADRELSREIDLAEKALLAGVDYDGLEDLRARAAGSDHSKRLELSLDAVAAGGALPPDELAAYIASQPAATDGDELDHQLRLQKIQAHNIKALKDDGLQLYADRGWLDIGSFRDESGGLILNDPARWTQRIAAAETIRQTTGVAQPQLTRAEENLLEAQLDAADIEGKLTFATALQVGAGDAAPLVLEQLGQKDPDLAHAALLAVETGEFETSRRILLGAEVKKGDLPVSAADRRALAAEEYGDALPVRVLSDAIGMAEKLFVGTPGAMSLEGDGAERQFRNSLQAVLGGRVRPGGERLGGVQAVNGVRTALPPDFSAGAVEAALKSASVEDFRQASVTGGVPHNGKKPILPRNPVIRHVGDGRYLLIDRGRGAMGDPQDEDGLFHFRLEDLRAAQVRRAVAGVPDEPNRATRTRHTPTWGGQP